MPTAVGMVSLQTCLPPDQPLLQGRAQKWLELSLPDSREAGECRGETSGWKGGTPGAAWTLEPPRERLSILVDHIDQGAAPKSLPVLMF